MKKLIFVLLAFSFCAQADPPIPIDLSPGDRYHLVFITNSRTAIGYGFQGLTGADNLVQAEATTYGVGSLPWIAILSGDAIDARDRIPLQSNIIPVYDLRHGKIADGYTDFWDGSLQRPISSPPGNSPLPNLVRTGTNYDGTSSGYTCNDWTSRTGVATTGYKGKMDQGWVNTGTTTGCERYTYIYGMSEEIVVPDPVDRSSLVERDLLSPGDKLLTYDSVTELEWLDVTATKAWTYSQTMNSAYVTVHGFRFATKEEIQLLVVDAGFNGLIGQDHDRQSAKLLIEQLGHTDGSDKYIGTIGRFPLNSSTIQTARINAWGYITSSNSIVHAELNFYDDTVPERNVHQYGHFLVRDGAPIDTDGDGIPDDIDICNGGDDTIDNDGDLVPDFCDPCPIDQDNDADGDGVCGDADVCVGGDDTLDFDGDSTPDFCDVCPVDPGNDADGDGLCESDDNCEATWNPDQTDSDGDLFGDACDPDNDNDGIPDGEDNCTFDANAGQEDWDNDGIGDLCDDDYDGDGVIDSDDQCLDTVPGDAVDASGCSIAELCPCEHPVTGSKWKNHGGYVKCVAHTSESFVGAGLISEAEKDEVVSNAGNSQCGHKN